MMDEASRFSIQTTTTCRIVDDGDADLDASADGSGEPLGSVILPGLSEALARTDGPAVLTIGSPEQAIARAAIEANKEMSERLGARAGR